MAITEQVVRVSMGSTPTETILRRGYDPDITIAQQQLYVDGAIAEILGNNVNVAFELPWMLEAFNAGRADHRDIADNWSEE